MKKQFTIVAVCDCGCKAGRVVHERAVSPSAAKRAFQTQLDPEWPMSVIAILRGRHYNQLPTTNHKS